MREQEVRGLKYTGRRVAAAVDGKEVGVWLGVRSDLLDRITSIPELSRFVDEHEAVTSVARVSVCWMTGPC